GGWIADRIWGARRSVLWGGIIIAAGHYVMTIPTTATSYLGLILIILGSGLLKPNISAQVGGLYHSNDERRDSGFTIFYMAIIASPIVYFGYMFTRGGLNSGERSRLTAFLCFFLGACVFWMIYDQSGSQLNLFAADKTDLSIFGWQMPAVWLQSANPFFIMVF